MPRPFIHNRNAAVPFTDSGVRNFVSAETFNDGYRNEKIYSFAPDCNPAPSTRPDPASRAVSNFLVTTPLRQGYRACWRWSFVVKGGRNFAGTSDPSRNANFSRNWDGPEPIGDVSDRIGRKAVAHWLKMSERLDGEERAIALATADDLRKMLVLSWADLLDRRIAA